MPRLRPIPSLLILFGCAYFAAAQSANQDQARINLLAQAYLQKVRQAYYFVPEEAARCRKAWSEVYEKWSLADDTARNRGLVTEWLREAKQGLNPDKPAELPAPPTFVRTLNYTPLLERSPPADVRLTIGPNNGTIKRDPASPSKLPPHVPRSKMQPTELAIARRVADRRPPSECKIVLLPAAPLHRPKYWLRLVPGEIWAPPEPLFPGTPGAVNLDELAARIRGHRKTLSEFENVVAANRRWTAAELATIVGRLREIARERRDIALYLSLIEESHRAAVGELADHASVIALIEQRIQQRRAVWEEFDRQAVLAKVELATLEDLSRELAAMKRRARNGQRK